MSTDPGHWIIVRPRAEVAAQARRAMDQIKAANGGTEPPTLRAAYDVDRGAFSSLVEALVQLGADVDEEMQQLAGIRDVGELL